MTAPGEFTGSRPDKVLTAEAVKRIREAWLDGVPKVELVRRFHLSGERIMRLVADLPPRVRTVRKRQSASGLDGW